MKTKGGIGLVMFGTLCIGCGGCCNTVTGTHTGELAPTPPQQIIMCETIVARQAGHNTVSVTGSN